jgi:hypothetical protein
MRPCADLAAADWLVDDGQPWQRLVDFGPAGFPAYARLRFLPDPAYEGQSENDADDPDGPTETEQIRLVLETLARHTRTPDDCYFCLWDGWGTYVEEVEDVEPPALVTGDGWRSYVEVPPAQAVPGIAPVTTRSTWDGPKLVLPHRAYYVFRGAVTDLGDWGGPEMWPGRSTTYVPDPAFVWPADRAWCLADDVDPHWAGIGADRAAIDELLADPRLDVVRADPDEDQPRYR